MPSFSRTATGATDWVNLGPGYTPVAISGTFSATVALEVRLTPTDGATVLPLARDTAGTAYSTTIPTGVFMVDGLEAAPDAQIRANVTAYTSGTVVIQIGR